MVTSSDDYHLCLSQIWSRYEAFHSKMSCPTFGKSDTSEWKHIYDKGSKVIYFILCISDRYWKKNLISFCLSKMFPQCFGKWTLHICIQLWTESLCDHWGWVSNLPSLWMLIKMCKQSRGVESQQGSDTSRESDDFRLNLKKNLCNLILTLTLKTRDFIPAVSLGVT